MPAFDEINKIVGSCVKNAEELLSAAKAAFGAEAYGSAYHLAALALEEIGKATLVLIAKVKTEPSERYLDTAADHEKKLFWALWTPSLKSGDVSGQQLQDFHELAREIHARRLGAMYVDASTGLRLVIAPERAKQLISLAESRVGMEKLVSYGEPDKEIRQDFEWFESATGNKETARSLIFARSSFDKLKELNGDVKAWVHWLRGEANKSEAEAVELLKRELEREQPSEKEKLEPKWKVRIRLYSDSHSIRPGPLTAWNKRVDFIKLFRVDARTLLVDFTMPKGLHVNGVYAAGYSIAARIIASFNIGSFGLFYWYMPSFLARYYEHITDLENDRNLDMDMKSEISIDWGKKRAWTDEDLSKCTLVFNLIARFDKTQLEAVDHYLRGLGLLCKGDMFVHLAHGAVQAFYVALKTIMRSNVEWDGTESFAAAAERALPKVFAEMKDAGRVMELAALIEQRTPDLKVTSHDVFIMKVLCDIYLVQKAQHALEAYAREKHETLESASSEPITNPKTIS